MASSFNYLIGFVCEFDGFSSLYWDSQYLLVVNQIIWINCLLIFFIISNFQGIIHDPYFIVSLDFYKADSYLHFKC